MFNENQTYHLQRLSDKLKDTLFYRSYYQAQLAITKNIELSSVERIFELYKRKFLKADDLCVYYFDQREEEVKTRFKEIFESINYPGGFKEFLLNNYDIALEKLIETCGEEIKDFALKYRNRWGKKSDEEWSKKSWNYGIFRSYTASTYFEFVLEYEVNNFPRENAFNNLFKKFNALEGGYEVDIELNEACNICGMRSLGDLILASFLAYNSPTNSTDECVFITPVIKYIPDIPNHFLTNPLRLKGILKDQKIEEPVFLICSTEANLRDHGINKLTKAQYINLVGRKCLIINLGTINGWYPVTALVFYSEGYQNFMPALSNAFNTSNLAMKTFEEGIIFDLLYE